MAALLLPGSAVCHQYADSPFRKENRNGRFPFLGVISYLCSNDPKRPEICSGQGFLVSPCIIVTADHISLDRVTDGKALNGLRKKFKILEDDVDVSPLAEGDGEIGGKYLHDNFSDWGLMRLPAGRCLGNKFGWARIFSKPARNLPVGSLLIVTSVDEDNPNRLIRSYGRYEGPVRGDVLLMSSASMRPGQSGAIVTTVLPGGEEAIVGLVQGGHPVSPQKLSFKVKRFSVQFSNWFTDLSVAFSESEVNKLIQSDIKINNK